VRYFLDATFIIDHLRRDASAVAKMRTMMADGDELFINEVVACEAWSGRRSAEDRDLAQLLTVPEFIQPGPATAEHAGRWRADARARGWTLSTADALIATAADAVGATILTRNERDFALTPVPVATY
jgi:predicted nucleic acid-binding protein